MNNYQLVYPMFALVLLTMIVLTTLFRRRVKLLEELGPEETGERVGGHERENVFPVRKKKKVELIVQ